MSGAPTTVTAEQLAELGLSVVEKDGVEKDGVKKR
jgi:hypothetical protein